MTSDFVFLGSCSMVATAGHSSENRNVAMWDSLLPKKKAMVAGKFAQNVKKSETIFFFKHFAVMNKERVV